MNFTELRIKIRHFLKKYKRIIIIVLSIWAFIIFINYLLKNKTITYEPSITYEPHVSVMDDSSTTPKTLQQPIETLIEKYVTACNEQNYQEAFNLLSDECREYEFDNNPAEFLNHVLTKMPSPREYSIQNYSNINIAEGNLYIYEVRYTEDMLATGLTNSEYLFTSEKMAFLKDKDGNIKMSVGSYIYHTPIQSVAENEYLKIDVVDKKVNYSIEEYEVKFTNRSEYTVVIADSYGKNEVELQLINETRGKENQDYIILEPGQSITQNLIFSKFVDDGDSSLNLIFGSVRVMQNYSGIDGVDEETIQRELDNAIAKFSMTVSVAE